MDYQKRINVLVTYLFSILGNGKKTNLNYSIVEEADDHRHILMDLDGRTLSQDNKETIADLECYYNID